MLRVGIAGGSNGIGKAISDAIKSRQEWEVVILGRKASGSMQEDGSIALDYSDVDQLRTVLETHKIHTVICAISFQHESAIQNQLNLIEAAVQSSCTKKFMPSEFGIIYKPEHIRGLPLYAGKFEAVQRLETSNLEYTRFSNGLFMDYFFDPYIPSAFPINIPLWVDLAENFASIPGDGTQSLVMTHSRDVGQFVAALIELDKWQETRYCLTGDRLTVNEFVQIAESVKGVKFEKHYDSLEELDNGQTTLLPSVRATLPTGAEAAVVQRLIADAGARVVRGEMDLPQNGSLNEMFPELQTLKVQDAVKIWFAGQEGKPT